MPQGYRGQAHFSATKFRLIISFFLQSFLFKEAFCVLMIVLLRGPEGSKSEIWIYGFMPALDTGFDQSTLICRDLHHGNSIKLLRSFTEVPATLEPFVKDNCKSGISKKTLMRCYFCDGLWIQIMSLFSFTLPYSICISILLYSILSLCLNCIC